MLKSCYGDEQAKRNLRVNKFRWYVTGTGFLLMRLWPLFKGAGETMRPIHHWGDGEAAGEWGGCGGNRGHWRFWYGRGWEVEEFIRIEVGPFSGQQTDLILKNHMHHFGDGAMISKVQRVAFW